jgi:hypothetical protein
MKLKIRFGSNSLILEELVSIFGKRTIFNLIELFGGEMLYQNPSL